MKNLLSQISIFLSVVCILILIKINLDIAGDYRIARGKTRALFALTILLKYGYKYYFVLLGVSALILSIIAKFKKERFALVAIILSILAIIFTFLDFYELFV